ncbi:hypothetical protein J1N35_039842 [Gossypium stocksii]|uniref:VQ domain-containing protein n=1 Tax=Gossypium stocksii TaxID=47602 RepID=A0A9D3ZI55_9ROSI|nr:hypothetical protein J1N35_039842 [Gossypium stocksii]
MDVLGVHQMKNKKKQFKRRDCKKDIKVVYISSPMKVKTCASQFRALVQKLTGKDSNAAVRFMDNDDNVSDHSPAYSDSTRDDRVLELPFANSNHQSMFESYDEGSFWGMFTSNLFHDPSQLDTFRSIGST